MGRHRKDYPAAGTRTPAQRGPHPAGVTDARTLGPSPLAPPVVSSTCGPGQRLPGIEVVDAVTKAAHLVSPDELVAGQVRGDYQERCSARFLAASLVEPGRGRCQPRREQAAP